MSSLTVLVTGVGSTTGISVLKGFKEQNEFDVRIVGTDINPPNLIAGSSFCDAFYSVPPAGDPNYVPYLIDVCQIERVSILIPIIDPELLAIAEHKQIFDKNCVSVIVSDPQTIRICNDKYSTFKFFVEHNVPTPETWLASEITDPGGMSYPLFVKPRDGVSSVNAFRVDSLEEFYCAAKKIPNLIVQEYIDGDEYTIDVLADLEGKVFAVVPRQRLQTKAGISYKGRTRYDEYLINWGKFIAETLHIKGPANIQCKLLGNQASFFEVNPRFSGSLPLTIAAGVNGPWWILKLLAYDKPPEILLPFKELIMTRYWMEKFYSS